jgi:hypothetical protein
MYKSSSPNLASFVNYDETEEATKITTIQFLEPSYLKQILIIPIMTLITLLLFPLFIHWYPTLKKNVLYKVTTRQRATMLFIVGFSKIFYLLMRYSKEYGVCEVTEQKCRD